MKNEIMKKMLFLFGDYAYDYEGFYLGLGYAPHVEILGWSGMYQFIRVQKDH